MLSESVDDTILFALVENNSNTDVSARDFEMFKSMLVLIGSVIAAVASIIAALISARNQKKLKKMEEYRAEQDARREYEYEARKRLYREFEPLIFMLCEDSDSAYNHIKELSNMSRFGKLYLKLSSKTSNKENDSENYLRTTIYKLILPMAVFSLMQRRLTLFDLHLENYYRLQYTFSKCLYFSCSNSYYIALGGKRQTDHNLCLICKFQGFIKHTEEKKLDTNHPNHIVINILDIDTGMIDSLSNSLIKYDENDKISRIRSFHEFKEDCFTNINTTNSSIKKMYETFSSMTVTSNKGDYLKYLLIWRILLLHVCVYWIMKQLVKKKYFKNIPNNNDTIFNIHNIKELIGEFLEKEADKFRWITEYKENNNNEIIESMDDDYRNSKTAIRNYLEEWIEYNYEESIPRIIHDNKV